MRFSICVCTYNRANILPYCLVSLANLKMPPRCKAEILVIDNKSVDNTKEVVEQYSRRSPIQIFYFYEQQQGLSNARNRAIKEAHGDYLGFLDDECVVAPDWLQILAEDIEEFAPFIIGGPYVGALLPGTGPKCPKWLKMEYFSYAYYASFERGYQKEFRASGGNMLLHRMVCETQKFDQDLGMKGNELKLGEEILLQDRFLSENLGAMVFYEPRIEVTHYILPDKMSLSSWARRELENGACRSGSGPLLFKLVRSLAYLCVSPLGALFRDRSSYPYWQNYAYEKVIPRAMPVIGAALERFRGRYRSH
jgi:glycosyltransferase involved in cell wall biosynthesis